MVFRFFLEQTSFEFHLPRLVTDLRARTLLKSHCPFDPLPTGFCGLTLLSPTGFCSPLVFSSSSPDWTGVLVGRRGAFSRSIFRRFCFRLRAAARCISRAVPAETAPVCRAPERRFRSNLAFRVISTNSGGRLCDIALITLRCSLLAETGTKNQPRLTDFP